MLSVPQRVQRRISSSLRCLWLTTPHLAEGRYHYRRCLPKMQYTRYRVFLVLSSLSLRSSSVSRSVELACIFSPKSLPGEDVPDTLLRPDCPLTTRNGSCFLIQWLTLSSPFVQDIRSWKRPWFSSSEVNLAID